MVVVLYMKCINLMNENRTIYSRFREVARRRPDAPAIVGDGFNVSFSELLAMADEYAAGIRLSPARTAGIVMKHGPRQIAAMLGVLKPGGAYVPAEPSLPARRIDYMMRQAGASPVITDSFVPGKGKTAQADESKPHDAAYILYTSGTSGRPKGVIVENHSVVNYAEAFEVEFGVGPGDVMLQYSVCSFDIFVEEVFATLLNGAALAIPSAEVHDGPVAGLMDFAARHGVTILDGFPYLLAELNKLPALPPTVRLIISGGDVLRESFITNLRRSGARIYNTYGPSETTVCSNYFRVDNAKPLKDGTFPVGKAVRSVKVKILDENLAEVPAGQIGEICISGEGVARGYLGNPPEQSNFVTLADGTRLYRSGDMGYELASGDVVFLHRRDSQVMILGRRVEPDEVESVLNQCPEVERGVVRSFPDDSGLQYLVAYFVPKHKFSLHGLREWLRARLADFMVPEFFVALKRIPVTVRGKVDTSALPVVMKEGRL